MAKTRKPIIELPSYTAIFLAINYSTKEIAIGNQYKGITRKEIDHCIKQLYHKLSINISDKTPSTTSNKIGKLIKEGIILKSDDPVTNKRFRYITNKKWIVNKVFSLVDCGFNYEESGDSMPNDPQSIAYFQWLLYRQFNNYCRMLYRVSEDINVIHHPKAIKNLSLQFQQRVASSILDLFEHFLYMQAFSILDDRYRFSDNPYWSTFQRDCLSYVKNKLINEHLYLADNIMGDVIYFDKLFDKHKKNREELLQKVEELAK